MILIQLLFHNTYDLIRDNLDNFDTSDYLKNNWKCVSRLFINKHTIFDNYFVSCSFIIQRINLRQYLDNVNITSIERAISHHRSR